MKKDIKLIKGNTFSDYRGILNFFNDFDFTGVKRYYLIYHDDTSVVRGWHGHQFECKWFQCIKGSFVLSFIYPDNWEHPSLDLEAETFYLTASDPILLYLPEGYANCIRATDENSVLLVYSGKELEEAKRDSWRWEPQMWNGDKI